jgi:hypothetical protein
MGGESEEVVRARDGDGRFEVSRAEGEQPTSHFTAPPLHFTTSPLHCPTLQRVRMIVDSRATHLITREGQDITERECIVK